MHHFGQESSGDYIAGRSDTKQRCRAAVQKHLLVRNYVPGNFKWFVIETAVRSVQGLILVAFLLGTSPRAVGRSRSEKSRPDFLVLRGEL